MLKYYRNKLITGLMTLLVVFMVIFIFGFVNLLHSRPLIDVGLSASVINWIVIIFSLVSMLNIIVELFKVK